MKRIFAFILALVSAAVLAVSCEPESVDTVFEGGAVQKETKSDVVGCADGVVDSEDMCDPCGLMS